MVGQSSNQDTHTHTQNGPHITEEQRIIAEKERERDEGERERVRERETYTKKIGIQYTGESIDTVGRSGCKLVGNYYFAQNMQW